MVAEQEETRRALQIALQMETDGKAFYLKASQESGNELGKELMQSLAAEEDIHRQKFEEIYEAISRNQALSRSSRRAISSKTSSMARSILPASPR